MRKLLFILASTAALAMIDVARAQMYVPPTPGLSAVPPTYAVTPNVTPGYKWREQRANDDWRNNTWREQRTNDELRNNTWREQRANEDWRQREKYEKDRAPNNPVDVGNVECGVGSVGSSCQGSPKDKTKDTDTKDRTEKYDYTKDRMRNNGVGKYVGECSVRLCR